MLIFCGKEQTLIRKTRLRKKEYKNSFSSKIKKISLKMFINSFLQLLIETWDAEHVESIYNLLSV